MKKLWKAGTLFAWAVSCVLLCGFPVHAESEKTVKNGIFAGNIDLSGMTADEAQSAVQTYVEELKGTEITLLAAAGREVVITAGDLGMSWANPELVSEAIEIGTRGNVIERYKVLKDLEHENQVYPIELAFDLQTISDLLTHKCARYDVKAVNVSLKKEGDSFQVIEGKTGYLLDVETSIDLINNYLTQEWNHQPCTIALDVAETAPRGSAEELAEVKDILGTFTTSYSTSGSARSANVENGCRLIDGVTLYPGEEFSTYEMVSPFSVDNGYYMAGSYVNGKVVDSLGGGICQVSTTLYNAVLLAELEVTERHNHSMIVSYVEPSADAAIAESSGKDFRFVNNQEYPIYIEGYTKNKKIVINIYGKETRQEDYSVRYESEVLEVINPPADLITPDSSQPLGWYSVTSSAHIGYKARLWKVVTQGGAEVERTQINSSSYKMAPRSVTVGTATSDPAAYEQLMGAIGTANFDYVKSVLASLVAQTVADNAEIGEE